MTTGPFAPRTALARTLAALASAAALAASAHTPYLLPSSFEVSPKAVLGVQASFADKFFIPEVPIGDTPFTVTGPDGQRVPFAAIHQLKLATVAEHPLPDLTGTYRLSTGPRLGAIFRSWERNGKVEVIRDPKAVMPADAKLVAHYQSLSVSESYVTAGKPSRAALAPSGQGLEIVPITHPSDLFAGEAFEFTVQFDGKPLAGQQVDVYRSAMDLSSEHQAQRLQTDAQGRVKLALKAPGVYLALVRHRAAAPAGAAAPLYGHNHTLTFRVLAP